MTTLFVAVGGLIGVMSRYGLTRLTIHHETLLWITGVGVLGGFTTFSTFSVQAVLDVDAGEPRRAAVYVTVSIVGGLAAATAGYVLGRHLA
jgi:CrcB protein